MIGWERYRLVLYHEFVDVDGKRHRIDDPITAEEVFPPLGLDMDRSHIVNRIIERLTNFVLSKAGEEE